MKIYTKTGDKGETSLLGGIRVPKHHARIEAYGTIDELNSWVGLLKCQPLDEWTIGALTDIQDRLFTIGSHLAVGKSDLKMKLPELFEKDIESLEIGIDKMNEKLAPMNSFILPGGNTIVSYCHITRCVCRRSERKVSTLMDLENIDDIFLKYLNRLADFLFVLARKLSADTNAEETPWKARK